MGDARSSELIFMMCPSAAFITHWAMSSRDPSLGQHGLDALHRIFKEEGIRGEWIVCVETPAHRRCRDCHREGRDQQASEYDPHRFEGPSPGRLGIEMGRGISAGYVYHIDSSLSVQPPPIMVAERMSPKPGDPGTAPCPNGNGSVGFAHNLPPGGVAVDSFFDIFYR